MKFEQSVFFLRHLQHERNPLIGTCPWDALKDLFVQGKMAQLVGYTEAQAIREPIIKKLLLVENQCFSISKQKSIDIRILFQPCDCPDFQVEFELHQGKHIDRYFTLRAIPLPELIRR
ncbi:MAG: hypothetical protein ACKOF3_05910 [Spartobacteria bacterium]